MHHFQQWLRPHLGQKVLRLEEAPSGQAFLSALFHVHLGSSGQPPPEENPDGLSFELADASLTAELDQLGMLGHGDIWSSAFLTRSKQMRDSALLP